MKLASWAIADALARQDWAAAIDAACDLFGLPRLPPSHEMVLDALIQNSMIPGQSIRPQIKICYRGKAFSWCAGRTAIWQGTQDAIYIWAPLDGNCREAR